MAPEEAAAEPTATAETSIEAEGVEAPETPDATEAPVISSDDSKPAEVPGAPEADKAADPQPGDQTPDKAAEALPSVAAVDEPVGAEPPVPEQEQPAEPNANAKLGEEVAVSGPTVEEDESKDTVGPILTAKDESRSSQSKKGEEISSLNVSFPLSTPSADSTTQAATDTVMLDRERHLDEDSAVDQVMGAGTPALEGPTDPESTPQAEEAQKETRTTDGSSGADDTGPVTNATAESATGSSEEPSSAPPAEPRRKISDEPATEPAAETKTRSAVEPLKESAAKARGAPAVETAPVPMPEPKVAEKPKEEDAKCVVQAPKPQLPPIPGVFDAKPMLDAEGNHAQGDFGAPTPGIEVPDAEMVKNVRIRILRRLEETGSSRRRGHSGRRCGHLCHGRGTGLFRGLGSRLRQ